MEVSIVIVNYHLSKEIDQCIQSILEWSADVQIEIIIVDNSVDRDETEALVQLQTHDRANIICIFNESNIGFGRACNIGADAAKGKYVCFLNPDTKLVAEIFRPLITLLESDGSCAVVSPRQQISEGVLDFSAGFFPSVLSELLNILYIGRFLETLWIGATNRNEPRTVDWVMGAFILISRRHFLDIGKFDPAYFMFFEESDLCKRLKRSGFSIKYVPTLHIDHAGSVSGKKDYRFFTRQFYHSKLIFLRKSYRGLERQLLVIETYIQLAGQLVLWSILFPVKPTKSSQKMLGIIDVLQQKNIQ
ncbi:MAG: glycosyltransferase family 2 protein [Bacteroidota bacterium]